LLHLLDHRWKPPLIPYYGSVPIWFKSLLGDCRFLKSSRNVFFAGETEKSSRYFEDHVISNHGISRLPMHYFYGPSGGTGKKSRYFKIHVVSRFVISTIDCMYRNVTYIFKCDKVSGGQVSMVTAPYQAPPTKHMKGR